MTNATAKIPQTMNMFNHLSKELESLEDQGLYKHERIITSAQSSQIRASNKDVLNFCANNYLGLANHPEIVKAAHEGLDKYGYGMASVRFICGTLDIHKELESRLARFLGKEDCILYPSGFDANAGLFETLLTEEDAIISDQLNHASIIDGVRLCKAKRFRYANNDMNDLETQLKAADSTGARFKLIATDGVFSMDGIIANLPAICDLADKYNAYVMIDECHASGFMGKTGRGTHEYHNVIDRIDIITGTLGKALGGASGGFTAARREITEWLRNKSRTYLFSNTVAPVIAYTSLKALDLIEGSTDLRDKVINNGKNFRQKMEAAGFNLVPGEHPIIPVMLGDAKLAQSFADKLMEEGVYVIGFSFPVVPKGQARIRTQMSAAHSEADIDKAVEAFIKVGKELNVV